MKCLLAIPTALLLAGCLDDLCGNTPVETVDSPDGKKTAVLFQRDCGATTGFSSQVSIINKGEALSGGGNVFVADTNHGAASAASWGGPWVKLSWVTAGELHVEYDMSARVFHNEASVRGVAITYKTGDPR